MLKVFPRIMRPMEDPIPQLELGPWSMGNSKQEYYRMATTLIKRQEVAITNQVK